ncbi:MAG: hypothetical protein Q9204_004949 [Flavoplaca sp. TL-2023a]
MSHGAAKAPFVYSHLCLADLQNLLSEKLNLEGRSCGTRAAAFATLVNQHDVLAVQSLYQPYASTSGHDVREQTVGGINVLLNGNNRPAKLPNSCCSNSDQALQSQAIPTVEELGATRLIEGEFAPQTIYPTPDPRASMNIVEVIQPRVGSHDLTGDYGHVASVPDIDPPEYTEEDQSGQVLHTA